MPRKIPMRKCVATNERFPKKELLRVVRTPEGELTIDRTGRTNGQGEYLKKDINAVNLARKKGSLESALEMKIPEEFWQEIEEPLIKKDQNVAYAQIPIRKWGHHCCDFELPSMAVPLIQFLMVVLILVPRQNLIGIVMQVGLLITGLFGQPVVLLIVQRLKDILQKTKTILEIHMII